MIAVLGLGVLALVVDRSMLKPESASAAEPATTAAAPAGPAEPIAAATPRPEATAVPSLSVRLRAAADGLDTGRVRNVFGSAADAAANDLAEANPDETAALAFQRSRRLNSIVGFGDRGAVQIDGEIVAVGQAIDGFRLVEIDRQGAVFERNGVRVYLTASTEQEGTPKAGKHGRQP